MKKDYTDMFASFLAAHKRAEQGDRKAALDAQVAAQEIVDVLKAYNPFGFDLFGDEIEVKKKQDDELFEQCWIAYCRKGSKKKAKEYWKKLTDADKKIVLPHINAYVGSRDLCYLKDFERYLRDATFRQIVIKGNMIVFDPNRNVYSEYKPEQSYCLIWSEKDKMYVYVGFFENNFVPDGYEDHNRPDGAKVMLGNNQGVIQWSAEQKKWNKI